MEKILKSISIKALKYEDFEFSSEQKENNWLGVAPALEQQIKEVEKRLGVELPDDYKEFLLITNGFGAPNDIEPTFAEVEKIDFLKNFDSFIIEAYGLNELQESIIVAAIEQEQYFLLIPPKSELEKWKYWKFANWYPGEHAYENLKDYFAEVLEFINKEYEE